MATYIVLGNFTDQGVRNVKDTTKRANALREMAKQLGITVKEVFWTLGHNDIVAILDAPDAEAVTALTLSVGALGNVHTHTLRAFTEEEMGKVLKKMV